MDENEIRIFTSSKFMKQSKSSSRVGLIPTLEFAHFSNSLQLTYAIETVKSSGKTKVDVEIK
jgi:hypothetical protein